MPNNTLNTTELMTGKDGRLYVEVGGVMTFLAEIDNFAVNMTVNSAQVQPVGSILVSDVPTGVAFELTYSEMVIRDDAISAPLLEAIKQGKLPVYNFQGVATKPVDGQEQRLAFNNAVPKGTFGILNITPGEVVKREHAFALNSIPEYISQLASTYLSA